MAVLLPNGQFWTRKRAHPFARDAYDMPVSPAETGPRVGPWPGKAEEDADRGAWTILLDTRAWPIEPQDLVEESGGAARAWIVERALLHQVPGAPDVDHVQVVAKLTPNEVS